MSTPTRRTRLAASLPSPRAAPRASRCARMAGAVIVLAAACAMTACSDDLPPGMAAVPGSQADPTAPASQADSATLASQADTPLAARLAEASGPVVAGRTLHAALLRRFYARHQFEPVWASHPAQASALVSAVMQAGDQGLDPDLFDAALLRRRASLSPLDQELLLSDAFLAYADALARGAVPVERRPDDEVLTPDPIDVTATLDDAIDSPDPAQVIEALAPTTPTYAALRQLLAKVRPDTPAGKRVIETIDVNLERQRWLPRSLPADRAWVNVADQRLVLYRADQPVFSTRVVVGEDVRENQSPEFRAVLDASLYNPPWVIPKDIVTNEILPKISRDPDYLKKNDMILLAGGEAEQLPGPEAGLGLIMFDMPNKFDVYLHDTPDRDIFERANRRLSHGCIRVQDPRDFAALLMQEPVDAINQGIATGSTSRHALPTPVPVFVVYETAFVGTDGTLQFRPDFYHRDAAIWQLLQPRGAHGSPAEARRAPPGLSPL